MSDPLAPPAERQSRRVEHLSRVRESVTRRRRDRALNDSIYSAAESADDPYLGKLAAVSRSAHKIGVDGMEMFKAPGAYQAVLERDEAPPGFLDRMWARTKDGDLLNRRGAVGFRALIGRTDVDAALREGSTLRNQMSDAQWADELRGIEKQLGFALEMVGQQARNLPTAALAGLVTLGGGLALGSVGGPGGALAGGLGAFGTGAMIGMAAENAEMMSGLAFLDLMELPLVLPDGTETKMPVEVARGVGLVVGSVQAGLEVAQVGSWVGAVPGARQLANKAMTRLLASGKLRELAVRYATRHVSATGENVLEEMMQEAAGMAGTEVALALAKGKTGAERAEAIKLGAEFRRRMIEVATLAPAFGMMTAPQAAIGAVADRARVNPERIFDPEPGGEIVPIANLQLPEAVNERQRATTKALIEQARRGAVRLPPIGIARTEEGTMYVSSPDDQALVAALRTEGFQAVRVLDFAEEVEAQEKAADEPKETPAPTDEQQPKPGPVAIRSMSAFEAVHQQLQEAAEGTELTPEQATWFTILLERRAQAAGQDLLTYVRESFQGGQMFGDEELSSQLLEGLVPGQEPREPPPPREPSPDERTEQRTESERQTEQTQEEPKTEITAVVEEEGGEPATEPVEDAVEHEPSVTEIARQPGQTIAQWWKESLTTEGRRQALRKAGFDERQVDRVSKTVFRHLPDMVIAVLEREFPDPTEEGIPQWARHNFERQQALMRQLPNNIGKARQEGTLTPRHLAALDELEDLRQGLPDDSDLWRRIAQEAREKYDTDLAAERAATRAETEARMAAEGWSVGDQVWLPQQNMLTGELIYQQKGVVKINKAGIAYVAGAGKQFDLFSNKWTKVGDEIPGPPRRRAEPEPVVVQVDPSVFAEIPVAAGTDPRQSTGIVVWVPNDGSRLEVVGGFWRAGLAKRYAEGTEESFTVPAIRFREADGVSLKDAYARAMKGVSAEHERTLLPTARFLRNVPIDDKLIAIGQSLPPSLPQSDLRTIIGLNAVDDEVFEMVEAGKLSPKHASYLGEVPDKETQIIRATSMAADPPTTDYEAELRAGPFGAISDAQGVIATEELTAARILVAAYRDMVANATSRRVRTIERAAQEMVAPGGPLADAYRQAVSWRAMHRSALARLVLPTLWGRHGPFDGLVDQVDQGTLSLEDAAGQLLDALARAVSPRARDELTPERAQDVADETAPRVTWTKARIELTQQGVRAVPIESEGAEPLTTDPAIQQPEPTISAGEEKEAVRARLAQRLSLERITDSLRGEQPAAAPAPVPERPSAYVETKKGITNDVIPRIGYAPFEVSDWDGEGGWAMSSGMFRTENIPAAVRKRMTITDTPRRWDELSDQLRIDVDQAYEVQPVASQDIEMQDRTERPIAMVQEIGGKRDGFYDDRFIRYIRTAFRGRAKLHLQRVTPKMTLLLGIMDGQVVAAVPPLDSDGVEWAAELRQKARQQTPEAPQEPAPKPQRAKRVVPVRKAANNPTPDEAPAAPPVPPRPVKIESASETELLDGIEAMFDDEDAETDLLYSDGAGGISRMARAIYRLVELLMVDQELTDFPSFATALMRKWGNRRHRDRVFVAMRDWYEAGREAEVAEAMTPPAEIDRWYEENADVARAGGGDDRGPGAEPPPEGRPRAGGRRAGTGAVGAGDRGARGRPAQGDGRQRRPDDSGRGARDRDRPAPGGDRERGPLPPDVASEENWRFERGALDATEGRGPTMKARDNITAIELLKRLDGEGRGANPEEQAVLAKYVGWGGLQGAFPHPTTGKVQWEDVAARLRELLTPTEYEQARSSILYAHYTSETVIASMWDTLRRLGFEGGRIIEPGAGVGHFAGLMPPELAKNSGYFGIELDLVTAAIAKKLYPHWPIRQQDFSRTAVPPNTFDLAIGNPPFSNFSPADPKYDQHKFLLHDYFFAKALDGVKPGGMLAFVTSAGTMNKQSAKARRYLAARADFLGAVRLPNTAFLRGAGTEVTADIIFLRKRAEGVPENHVAEWVESRNIEMPTRDGGTDTGWVNPYFLDNPDQVLGEPGLFDELVAGKRYAVRERPGANLEQDLAAAVDRLVKAAPAFDPETAATPQAIEILEEAMKEGSYYINAAGALMQYRDGAGREAMRRGSTGRLVKMSKADQTKVRALLPVRDAYRKVLAADLADDAAAATSARAELNAAYERFVKKYGPIRKTVTSWRKVTGAALETLRQRERERARAAGEPWEEGDFDDSAMIAAGESKQAIAAARRQAREAAQAAGRPFFEGTFDPDAVALRPSEKLPNLSPFLGDPEAYRVMALEKSFDEDTGEAAKSEVFERNIIRRELSAKIETALDAMLHVLTTTGSFDIGAIASAWNRSIDETVQELGDLTYMDPTTRDWMMAEEYLSGNVVRRLDQARVATKTGPEFERNVQALEAVQPKLVSPTEIAVKIGSTWVPTEVYEAFGREVLQMPRVTVTHNVAQNIWGVEGESSQAGVAEFGAHYATGSVIYGPRRIFQEVLRLKQLKAPRIRDGDTSYEDKAGNIKVAEAIKHMQDAFSRWVWSNDKRRDDLADLYNAKFNTTVERVYRTDYITTPGVATTWKWREHQLRGIARIIVSGSTYLNHAVGAGKTSTMIAAAMELRRLGKARKPLFVVPNHMLAQFSTEWYQLYPRANLMIADEAAFHTSRRKRFVAEAGSGDYDAVIMTYDSWGLVPISDDFADQIIRDEISSFVEAMQEADDRFTRKRLEEAIKRMEARLTRGAKKKRDQVFTFEELGVDMLFIDEAQKYRKLGFATTQSNVKGIDNGGGPTTMDAFIKTRYIESINPGRGLVFASGTPVTNTLSEIYSLQRFMDSVGLQEHGLQHFDSWASTFGAVEEEPERDVAGALAYVERFTGIPNAPELSRLVRRFMDVVTPEQLHQYVTIPKYRDGQREKTLVDQSVEQEWHHTTIVRRLEAAKQEKKFSEYLRLINEARLAAIDPRLLKPGELFVSPGEDLPINVSEDGHPVWTGEGSKLNVAIDNIFRIWKDTADHPFYGWGEDGQYTAEPEFRGPATQIVFSPLGFTVQRGRLHLPTHMRAQLVRRGVPDTQIAYMGDYDTHTKKKRLFNDMNEGKIRILIGSERNMGTGVNVQERLLVEHNLAPVWFPADDEQRVGRILRQGNRNREVRVMDYSTVGSYDYAMWQMMSRKGKAIERFFRGDPSLRFVGDIGEHAHYSQLMALTAEDPRLLQLVELQNELTKAEREKAASDDRIWNRRAAVVGMDERIADTEQVVESSQKALARRTDEYKGDKFRMTVGSRSYTERADAAVELSARWNAFVGGATGKGVYHADFGEFAGFAIEGSFTRFATGFISNPVVQLSIDGTPVIGRALPTEYMDDPGPLLVRSLAQRLGLMEKNIREALASIKSLRAEREKLQADLDTSDAVGPERVNELRAAVRELETAIRAEAAARDAPPAQPDQAPPESPDDAEPQVLQQTRASRGGNPLAEQMVQEYGADSIDTTGYVLRDGRMAAPPARGDPVAIMRASDTAWIDARARIVRAEGPLSTAQMAAIIEQMPDAPARLIHTVDGREQVNVQTRDPLTPATLRSAFPAPEPDVLHQDKLGAVWFDQEGKAVIALSKEADFDTLMEEFAHVFRRQLSGDQEEAIAEWAGARRDPVTGQRKWSEAAEEKFARGFVDWLREGVIPNDAVLTTFERARKWLRDIYAGIRSQLNNDVRRVFEDLIVLNDYPEIAAFERVSGELGAIEGEGYFTDGGHRLRVRREGGAYLVDAHDDKGRQTFNRSHADVADAAREIIGLPTVETPMPAGNRAMRIERADERAAREREAELRIATDDVTLREVATGTGIAEEQLLHQTRDDERRANLAKGRKTQLLNRLQELGVEPGEVTPWSSKPANELSYEDLRRVYEQLLEARREGRAFEVRRYERREVLRYGRQRLRTIQASLQNILRETKTLPEPLRDGLRKLLNDLELNRAGRASVERVDPAAGETDPARLLAVLARWVDREDLPIGTLIGEEIDKPLADMTLMEMERLHNTIQHTVHQVRVLQGGLQSAYRQEARRVAAGAAGELRRRAPVRSGTMRRALTALAGERPGFLLERMGGGLRSALYSTLYRDVAQGAQEKRRVVQREGGRYIADLRAAGITRTSRQLEVWLREAVDVPEWATKLGHTWRRGELMSLALMWRDPYSRRNLIDPRSAAEQEADPFPGGIVFVDRGRQATTPVQLEPAQIIELISLLGPEEHRFIDRPLRGLFDRLYGRLNDVFFRKYGYHLEQAPEYFPIEVSSAHVPDNPEAGGAVDFYRRQEAAGSAEPFQGMVQWRTGAIKPMVLRPVNTVVNRALDRSASYAGLELPLTAARRLMARRNVTALMRERWGADVPNVLNRYLRDVAGSGEIQDGMERFLMSLKRNVSVASLGLSGKVALSQALSLPLYSIHVPWRYLVNATASMARPSVAREVMQSHTKYDPDFAERSNYGFDPDIERGKMFSSRGVLPPDRSALSRHHERATSFFMWGIRRVDRFTVARGEQAAILHAEAVFEGQEAMPREMFDELGVTAEQARARPVEERLRLAYQWGNWVTGRTQPSFLAEHMSAFARGKITRYFASFSGYTNVAFNALRRAARVAREGNMRDGEANRAAMMAIMSIMVIGPLGVSLMGYIRSLARGDEPDPLWKAFLAAQSALVYGWKDVQYWLLTGRRFGRGIDNPTMAATEDMISSLDALARAIGSGERVRAGEITQAVVGIPPWEPAAGEDRVERAARRVVASGFRMVGMPYWTPRGWSDMAGNIPELLD